jgi:hypothetical protein
LKHVRPSRPFIPIAVAVALGLIASFGPAPGTRANAQVAPPPPPGPAGASTPAPTFAPAAPTVAPSDTASPEASAAPHGRHHRGAPAPESSSAPEPTATPTSPAFATLDGTWEFQLQFIDRTEYSYLVIAQQPTGTVSGVWRVNKNQYPFDGTYDGRLFRVLVKEPSGNVTMSGYVEGASDIVGIVDLGNSTTPTAFTAEHRASQKGGIFKKTTTY